MSQDWDKLKGIFDGMDKDGSGMIEARELIQLMTCNMGLSEDDAKNSVYYILKDYDKNDDKKITWEEFKAGYTKECEAKK